MNNFMLDIETLGDGTNGAIVSIGLVAFDFASGKVGRDDPFYVAINLEKSKHPGVIDAANVEWWFKQDEKARAELFAKNAIMLEYALPQLNTWLTNRGVSDSYDNPARLWSKPPMFDERLMREAYARYGWNFPFHWRASRDVRTLLVEAAGVADKRSPIQLQADVQAQPVLVPHNALHDAIHQAEMVIEARKALHKKLIPHGILTSLLGAYCYTYADYHQMSNVASELRINWPAIDKNDREFVLRYLNSGKYNVRSKLAQENYEVFLTWVTNNQ